METTRTIPRWSAGAADGATLELEPYRGARSSAAVVAVLVRDPGAGVRIRAALAALATPYFAADAGELLDALHRHRIGAIVLQCSPAGMPTEALVRSVRRAFPLIPMLLYCEVSAEHMRLVPALVRAGADELVLRGVDDLRATFRRSLLRSASARFASYALETLREHVPEAAEPLVAYCLRHADRPLTVQQVARDLGVSRKTLCNRAMAAGLPAPGSLISWCRLLHAARLLEESGHSVDRAAIALGFGSGTALRNMLRRYTGLRPRELAARGGHGALLDLLKAQLAVPRTHRV